MLRGFLFIPVPVEGNSMENVLKQGDMVVMEKFSEIRRFDIVVFQLDNRRVSKDSRSFGTINKTDILGKARFVYYPLDEIKWIQ